MQSDFGADAAAYGYHSTDGHGNASSLYPSAATGKSRLGGSAPAAENADKPLRCYACTSMRTFMVVSRLASMY